MKLYNYVRSLPSFHPQTAKVYAAWKTASDNVEETAELARKTGASEADMQSLSRYKAAFDSGVRTSKLADVMMTVGRPLMEGGLIAFVGSLFLGGQITGSIGGHIGLVMGMTVTSFVGIGLFFKGLSISRKYPDAAIDKLSLNDRLVAGDYLSKRESMADVVKITTAPAPGPAVATRGDRMVVGGVVLRVRPDGRKLAGGADAPEKPPPR